MCTAECACSVGLWYSLVRMQMQPVVENLFLEPHYIFAHPVYYSVNIVKAANHYVCMLFRMYRAEKLPSTNLVFLITDAKATCLSCDPRPLRQAEQPCILSLNS